MKYKALIVLAIIGILFGIYRVVVGGKTQPPPPPLHAPSASPFPVSVAGSGIIEAVEENVRVQSQVAGLVDKILVSRSQQVRTGDPLIELDGRAQKALVERLTAEVRAAEERLALLRHLPRPENVVPLEQAVERAEAQLADLRTRLSRFEKTWESYPGSVSQDAIDQTRQQVKAAEASLGEAKANLAAVRAGAWEYEVREQEASLNAKRASLKEASQILSWHTVRAPKDGAILQINVRPGEWIAPGQAESPLLMGRTDRLQIRADIDEVNAVDVQKGARAIAYLRGYTDRQIPLEFERVDPYIIPKRQLTGNTTERVDVRVLQVIYRFTPPDFPVYAGQQVDIFIESKERPKAGRSPSAGSR